MVLLAAFAILVFNLFKRDIYLKIYGLPFSKSEYSELIAEDRQTELGFRQEWKDSLESGEIKETIDTVAKTPRDKVLAKKMFEDVFRSKESMLRHMDSKAVALDDFARFDKFLRCSEVIGDIDQTFARSIIRIEEAPLFYVASMVSSRNLKFMVFHLDYTTTLEECYAYYK